MATKLDDTTVQFGLANFALGSGSFKRNKLVFVHVQGEKAGAVAKGRLNTLKGAVKECMGASHAEVQLYSADECTPEHFIEHLSKVIKVDDMGGFSISKLTADYEAMIASAGPAGVPDALERAATRKTAAEMGTVEGAKALEAVKQPLGPFNWALFKASDSLELHNAGSMSVNEMTKWMADDQVLFGLLRMGFGAGKFRRIKWICLHWAGEKVSPVKRGRANALKKEIMAKLGPFSLTVRRAPRDSRSGPRRQGRRGGHPVADQQRQKRPSVCGPGCARLLLLPSASRRGRPASIHLPGRLAASPHPPLRHAHPPPHTSLAPPAGLRIVR